MAIHRLQRFLGLIGCVLLIGVFAPLPTANALDLPPAGTAVYMQTTGPNAPLSIGDYYTNVQGDNSPVGHEFVVTVPCAWPASLPITFAIFDPEVARPDPASGILAHDEIRDPSNADTGNIAYASNTSFRLIAPGGATTSATYTPTGGTNGLWVELATFTTGASGYGCGNYTLRTSTADNDDNAWVLRVNHDPDCTVTPGTCSPTSAAASALMDNANQIDDPDGLAGSGDELQIGMLRTSFQQYPKPPTSTAALACQNFYNYIRPDQTSVTFNNFDLDSNIAGTESVSYYPPASSIYAPMLVGSVSQNSLWNNPPTPATDASGRPLRGGDTYAITARDSGWWRIEVCVSFPDPLNQYVVEGNDGPLYYQQPPTPRMAISKSDGLLIATKGQILDYTLSFTNTSDLTTTPGAAEHVTLNDQLPAGTTFVDCSIDTPLTGTCSASGQAVNVAINEKIQPGQSGSAHVRVQVDASAAPRIDNVVTLSYEDELGNPFPPETATDIDQVIALAPPTAVTLVRLGATAQGSGVDIRWETTSEFATYGFYVRRGTSSTTSVRTSPLISAQGGGSYYWHDPIALSGTSYWLEEIEINGTSTWYGPVRELASTGNNRILLPLVSFNS